MSSPSVLDAVPGRWGSLQPDGSLGWLATATGSDFYLYATATVVGYLIGSISPAALLARRAGVDLRAAGSGNPGATNVGRVLGPRVGVGVGLADVAKGALPAAGFALLSPTAGLLAGLSAVVGHVSSPFLRGRGGKGVATAAGAVLGSHPSWAPVVLVVWLLVLVLSRWVALASVTAALSLLAVAVVVGAPTSSLVWAVVLAAIVILRHRGNLQRWWAHRRVSPDLVGCPQPLRSSTAASRPVGKRPPAA